MEVINILGGPGTGKSVLQAKLFANLKIEGISCEMIPEVAKKYTYESRINILENNQHYIFSKQLKELRNLNDVVDVVITDGSLINSIVYSNEKNPHFIPYILHEFNNFNNHTFYLKRETEYQSFGRRQNEESAKKVDDKTIEVLNENNIPFHTIGLKEAESFIKKVIMEKFV